MLNAVEKQRVRNVTSDMDSETAEAMYRLFEVTKPGCDENANELFIKAHHNQQKVSHSVISAFSKFGLVRKDGFIPIGIRKAIREAVQLRYLAIHDPIKPEPEPYIPTI